jgi:two-component system CheB/CheR fusion protein
VTATSPTNETDAAARAAQLAHDLEVCRRRQREHDEFLALMAHDLRTPLTSIRGHAQLLRRAPVNALGPALPAGLGTIIEQADRLTALTDLLLDVGRIRTGQVVLRRTAADLAHAVRRAVAALAGQAGAAAIEVEAPGGGLVVDADATRLLQIARALLAFAMGRTAGAGRVRARIAQDGAAGCLAVDDEGPVLQADECAGLLDRLVTRAADRATPMLGQVELYIARGMVEAHGGRIVAESPAPGSGVGARLSVWLPLLAGPAGGPKSHG